MSCLAITFLLGGCNVVGSKSERGSQYRRHEAEIGPAHCSTCLALHWKFGIENEWPIWLLFVCSWCVLTALTNAPLAASSCIVTCCLCNGSSCLGVVNLVSGSTSQVNAMHA